MTENRLVQSSPLRVNTPLFPLVQMNLDPVTVELDFMEPLVALGRSGFEGGKLGLDESRHLRFLGRQPTGTHTPGHDFLKRANSPTKQQ